MQHNNLAKKLLVHDVKHKTSKTLNTNKKTVEEIATTVFLVLKQIMKLKSLPID